MWRQHQPDATQPEVMGKNRWTQPTVLANFGYHSIKKCSLGLHLLIYFCTAKNQNRDEIATILRPSKQHSSPVICYTHLLLEAGTVTAPTRLLRSLTSSELVTSQDADGTLRFIVLTHQYSYQRLTFTALTIIILQAGHF